MKSKKNLINYVLWAFPFLFTTPAVNASETRTTTSDSLHRDIQVSFIPYVGTNGYMTDSVTCDLSINILAGSVKNVNAAEFGGLINRVVKNAGKCQLAGLGNIVGGTSEGFQGAGLFNISGNMQGVQSAGLLNYAKRASGIQMSGLINHAANGECIQLAGLVNNFAETSVLQISGLINNSQSVKNFQIAGLVNNTKTAGAFQISGLVNNSISTKAFQIAGLVNNTKEETGFQSAGLVNNASKIDACQIAGLVNNAKEIEGAQIAGLVNRASVVNGVQIGFLNIADSIHGATIGIINLVKNGYHKIEVSGDELFYSNVSFRSGTRAFHAIITAGIQPDHFDSPLWTYGSGVGTSFRLSNKSLFDLDGIFQHVIKEDHMGNNFLYRFYTGIDHKLFPKVSLSFGVTYNFLLTDTKDSHASEYSGIDPYHFTDHTFHKGRNLKSWAGFKVGLRFL